MKPTKTDKDRPKKKTQKRELRDQTIVAMAMEGKSGAEIAQAVSITRQTVSEVLNSDETRAILKRGESRITAMVDRSLDVVDRMLNNIDDEIAFKAAQSVLKTKGMFKEKVDLQHSFPKPTIIEKFDGSVEVLGTSEEEDET